MVNQQKSKAHRLAVRGRRVEANAFHRGEDAGWTMGYEQAYADILERLKDPCPHDITICGCEVCSIIQLAVARHNSAQGKE